MCGIVGSVGLSGHNCVPFLFEGLKRLEHRGYDSHGICVSKDETHHARRRALGGVVMPTVISEDGGSPIFTDLEAPVGIAHTRWATHGCVSIDNAHPHTSPDGKFFVVHNGTLENIDEIRRFLLMESGIEPRKQRKRRDIPGVIRETPLRVFHDNGIYNDCDSSVLPALLQYHYDEEVAAGSKGMPHQIMGSALKLTVEHLNVGGGAILAYTTHCPDFLYAYSDGLPLYFGAEDEVCYVSSESKTLSGYCMHAHTLQEGYCYTLDYKGVVYTFGNNRVSQFLQPSELSTILLPENYKSTELDGYSHHMEKEIHEQVTYFTKNSIWTAASLMADVVIFGCGSSYYAGMIGAIFAEQFGLPATVLHASELANKSRYPIKSSTLYIAITQSGETKDTLDAIKMFTGHKHIHAITNVAGSSVTRLADSHDLLNCGDEIGVASTKTMLATISQLWNVFNPTPMNPTVVAKALNEMWQKRAYIQTHAMEIMRDTDNCLFLGTGYLYPIAMEAALKMKEIAYIHAEGMPAAEMKHGPLALIDERMPTIFLCSDADIGNSQILSNIAEVQAREGKAIVFTDRPDKVRGDVTIELPHTTPEIQPLVFLMAVQLFAYYTAISRNKNVDKPRNLAKTVTV